jgi:hypothetical protein
MKAMSILDDVYGNKISPETCSEKKGLGDNFQVLI